MNVKMRQDIILAGAMLFGSVVLWVASLSLSPEAALFPRLLLVVIIGCALVIAGEHLVRLRRARRSTPSDPNQKLAAATREAPEAAGGQQGSGTDRTDDGQGRAKQWLISAALVGYVLAFVYVGPYTATFALLSGLYLLLSQVRTGKTVLVGALLAAGITAVLYGLFSLGLNVSMPDGILI